MEFYINEKLIITVLVDNTRVNVSQCQSSFIISFFRNKDFDLSLKEFRDRFSQVYFISLFRTPSLLRIVFFMIVFFSPFCVLGLFLTISTVQGSPFSCRCCQARLIMVLSTH